MTLNWRVVRLRAFRLEGEAEIHETLPVAFLGHRSTTAESVLPEVPETGGRKLGVANGVLDILVTEIVL